LAITPTDEAGSLDPEVLFDKNVDKDNGGGYCLESSVSFLQKACGDEHEQATCNYPVRFGDEVAGRKDLYAFADAE
ncbi:hypothetical protein MY4824_002375, partial [Beauveria thailandica]